MMREHVFGGQETRQMIDWLQMVSIALNTFAIFVIVLTLRR